MGYLLCMHRPKLKAHFNTTGQQTHHYGDMTKHEFILNQKKQYDEKLASPKTTCIEIDYMRINIMYYVNLCFIVKQRVRQKLKGSLILSKSVLSRTHQAY